MTPKTAIDELRRMTLGGEKNEAIFIAIQALEDKQEQFETSDLGVDMLMMQARIKQLEQENARLYGRLRDLNIAHSALRKGLIELYEDLKNEQTHEI